jgi:hypothetical protein
MLIRTSVFKLGKYMLVLYHTVVCPRPGWRGSQCCSIEKRAVLDKKTTEREVGLGISHMRQRVWFSCMVARRQPVDVLGTYRYINTYVHTPIVFFIGRVQNDSFLPGSPTPVVQRFLFTLSNLWILEGFP